MKAKGVRREVVEIEIDALNMLISLFKDEFMGYDLYNDFEVIDDKLYVLVDTAYHGSPLLEKRLLSDDKNQVEKFIHLSKLIELYKSYK